MMLKGDARDLPLKNSSVACVVSSPPYGVGISYDNYVDDPPWTANYQDLVKRSCSELARVVMDGGRVWMNVMPSVPQADAGRFNLSALWLWHLEAAGFQYRDTVVWQQDSFDAGCSWGSWARPSAPNLRGSYELILSMFKPPYKRTAPYGFEKWVDGRYSDEHVAKSCWEMTPWQDLARNVWKMKPARRQAGAPAPFPHELPARCIRLSTWPGETVLDPFAGSGVTVEVAESLGRQGIGVEL